LLNNRVDEGDLANLDSSLKKNTTYIKRLKNITADHLESIAAEFTLLKLSKYIAEVTAALFDNKLKNSSDIFAFVEVSNPLLG
jgi:regulator of nonsense transcripts 2